MMLFLGVGHWKWKVEERLKVEGGVLMADFVIIKEREKGKKMRDW